MALSEQRLELLHSIFVTALEGGITYWAGIKTYRWSKKAPDGTKVSDLEGFHAVVREVDDDDGEEHRIDAAVIDRGLNALAAGTATIGGMPLTADVHAYQIACQFNGGLGHEVDFDAEDADSIVQAGLFNDVMFG